MKHLSLALMACALVGAVSQNASAATDWQFKRADVRQMKLRGIVESFKEQTGRDSIFKNRSDENMKLGAMLTERRQAIRARLVGRLQAISERRSERAQRFEERYAERLLNASGRDDEEYETLPWEQPGYVGDEGDMPEVPLPAAVWLLGSAIGFLGWRSRKRPAQQVV